MKDFWERLLSGRREKQYFLHISFRSWYLFGLSFEPYYLTVDICFAIIFDILSLLQTVQFIIFNFRPQSSVIKRLHRLKLMLIRLKGSSKTEFLPNIFLTFSSCKWFVHCLLWTIRTRYATIILVYMSTSWGISFSLERIFFGSFSVKSPLA